MEQVEHDDENLFEITNVSYEEGRELLADGEVVALIKIEESGEFSLIVNSLNIPQTILRQFLDTYEQKHALIQSQIWYNPELLVNGWLESMGEPRNYIEQLEVSETSNDMIIVSYYTAIAMTALYGAMLASTGMSTIYAKRSKVAARVNLAPYPKIKLILADFIACSLIILFSQTLLVLYLYYVIGISFTSQVRSDRFNNIIGFTTWNILWLLVYATYKKRWIYYWNYYALVFLSRYDGTTNKSDGRKCSSIY